VQQRVGDVVAAAREEAWVVEVEALAAQERVAVGDGQEAEADEEHDRLAGVEARQAVRPRATAQRAERVLQTVDWCSSAARRPPPASASRSMICT
jgi:hypothetical protein